jgi:putative lysine transport system substrate-binding protein
LYCQIIQNFISEITDVERRRLEQKMKRVKSVLILVFALVLVFSLGACGSNDKTGGSDADQGGGEFRVGMECNYAPFNWTQSEESDKAIAIDGGGYAAGYDVEIAKKIAEGLGKKLVIVKTEWDGLIPALQSGKIDAVIAGMSPTEERKATVDFSDPYYQSTLVIVVAQDGKFADATALADFSGAKITGQLNTFHYTVIDQIPDVKKETALETFPAMIVALQSGRIDGYVSELPGAVSAQASNPDLSYVEFADGSGFEASLDDTAIAVALKKGSEEVTKVNDILGKITIEEREQLMNDAVKEQPVVAE